MNALWDEVAGRAGVALSEEQHQHLARYLDLLLQANARMNLTRITDRAAAEVQHVADSLTILPFLPVTGRVADVGTGGGVPGIPIAIARPDLQGTLIESTKKKATFLRDAVTTLALTNVQVCDQRVEDVAHDPAHREQYEVAVARAVATLDWLAEWCLPLVKKGGTFLAMKGPKVLEELPAAKRAIRMAGGGEPEVKQVQLPGTSGHVIVVLNKVSRSDPKLPRPATQAKGKPLS